MSRDHETQVGEVVQAEAAVRRTLVYRTVGTGTSTADVTLTRPPAMSVFMLGQRRGLRRLWCFISRL